MLCGAFLRQVFFWSNDQCQAAKRANDNKTARRQELIHEFRLCPPQFAIDAHIAFWIEGTLNFPADSNKSLRPGFCIRLISRADKRVEDKILHDCQTQQHTIPATGRR